VGGLPFDSQAAKYDNWRKTIEHARNLTGVPGMSVAVLHKGKVIFAEGFGKRNKNGDPVTAEVRTKSVYRRLPSFLFLSDGYTFPLSGSSRKS